MEESTSTHGLRAAESSDSEPIAQAIRVSLLFDDNDTRRECEHTAREAREARRGEPLDEHTYSHVNRGPEEEEARESRGRRRARGRAEK